MKTQKEIEAQLRSLAVSDITPAWLGEAIKKGLASDCVDAASYFETVAKLLNDRCHAILESDRQQMGAK